MGTLSGDHAQFSAYLSLPKIHYYNIDKSNHEEMGVP